MSTFSPSLFLPLPIRQSRTIRAPFIMKPKTTDTHARNDGGRVTWICSRTLALPKVLSHIHLPHVFDQSAKYCAISDPVCQNLTGHDLPCLYSKTTSSPAVLPHNRPRPKRGYGQKGQRTEAVTEERNGQGYEMAHSALTQARYLLQCAISLHVVTYLAVVPSEALRASNLGGRTDPAVRLLAADSNARQEGTRHHIRRSRTRGPRGTITQPRAHKKL